MSQKVTIQLPSSVACTHAAIVDRIKTRIVQQMATGLDGSWRLQLEGCEQKRTARRLTTASLLLYVPYLISPSCVNTTDWESTRIFDDCSGSTAVAPWSNNEHTHDHN